MAIDWTRGYTCEVRAYEVDRLTWADGARIDHVTSVQVARDANGDAPCLESGTLAVGLAPGHNFGERYVRVAMIARQAGATERVDVCTLLCTGEGGTVERGADASRIKGRSVIWPASKTPVPAGAYAPAGSDGARVAARMLASSVAAPVSVEGGGFALEEPYVFDFGCTVLEAAWRLLRAGGHRIRIDGRGRVSVGPMPSRPSLTLDGVGARLLHPGIEHALEWSGVPNLYVAMDGDDVAEATNDDPESPTSTLSRGYVVGITDSSPVRVDGETLQGYCERRLAEESIVPDRRTYSREWADVWPCDVVLGGVRSVGLDGPMRVESQRVEVGAGVTVTETAAREVRLWQKG